MSANNFLPNGVTDFLPEEAERIEIIRRKITNLFRSWGYDLIIPPMIEYVDTLLYTADDVLDKDTFKFVDQETGRLLAIRADITPQVARIDATYNTDNINRLCYIGSTVTTLPRDGDNSRTPIQVGAELFGSNSDLADIEILMLADELLKLCGIQDYIFDLSDTRIFNKICDMADLPISVKLELGNAVSRKSIPDIELIATRISLENKYKNWILTLIDLNGTARDVLQKAKLYLPLEDFHFELEVMEKLINTVSNIIPEQQLMCDYAESLHYHYYTGISFSVYAKGQSCKLLSGGRYLLKAQTTNKRKREAVGFSTDMQALLKMGSFRDIEKKPDSLITPNYYTQKEYLSVQKRRNEGERIIYILSDID